nr:unnamed protein product [Digitaria exilis]
MAQDRWVEDPHVSVEGREPAYPRGPTVDARRGRPTGLARPAAVARVEAASSGVKGWGCSRAAVASAAPGTAPAAPCGSSSGSGGGSGGSWAAPTALETSAPAPSTAAAAEGAPAAAAAEAAPAAAASDPARWLAAAGRRGGGEEVGRGGKVGRGGGGCWRPAMGMAAPAAAWRVSFIIK